MKQLVCEMCGGTDLVKDGGVFVCQQCGCKYSLEEAKKMMVEGSVKIDRTETALNYLNMAKQAYESSNLKEAENYANKVLEIDQSNWEACFLKGKTAGWQSTGANNRISEAVDYFTKAINNCSDESALAQLKKDAADEVSKLALASIAQWCNFFQNLPSAENAESLLQVIVISQFSVLKLSATCGTGSLEFNSTAATMLNNAAVEGFLKAQSEYTNGGKPIQKSGIADINDHLRYSHPSKYDWNRFTERCDACVRVLKMAISIYVGDDKEDVDRYNHLIEIATTARDSCSVAYIAGNAYVSSKWCEEYTFTEAAKKARNKEIAEWQVARDKIVNREKHEAEKQAAERQARIKELQEEYWKLHEDEKHSYDALQKKIKIKRCELQKKKEQFNDLRIFKRRERAELSASISDLERELEELQEREHNATILRDEYVDSHIAEIE